MKSFTIVHNDGWIKVRIDDSGHAAIEVGGINDKEIVVKAINQTFREGAVSGTLFTGDVVNPALARGHLLRAQKGTTWLGGTVTRLADTPEGPQFRIDWTTFPQITE